jgi:hypothetical protein
VLDHATKFRLDRRLQQRRGWLPSDQLDKEVSSLPDVSDKGEVVDSPQFKGELAPAADDAGE